MLNQVYLLLYNDEIMRIFNFLTIVSLLLVLTSAQAADLKKPTLKNPVAGKHYLVLDKPGRTKSPPGKVEVIDFFWYGCPHCYKQLEYTEAWEKDKPSYIYVRKIPVPFSGMWTVHARTYYTAQRLNMAARLHRPIFDAIHKEKRRLTNQLSIRDFFADQGVDPARFDDIYGSFSVDARLRSAQKEVAFYKIKSVPIFIINGKYMTDTSMAGSQANIIQIIKFLSEKEYQAGSQGQS